MKRAICILLSFFILVFSSCGVPEKEKPIEFTAKIISTETIIDYDGTVLLAVTIDWMNNSKETISYMSALECSAYQDGIELDKGYYIDKEVYSELKQNYDNRDNKIRPKIGLQITELFIVRNTNSVIEIEIEERAYHEEEVYLDKFLFEF